MEKNEQNWMTHSYAYKTKCIHTNRSITVWQSLFISIVCKFSYNTRSAAVLWPNKFNTTYAIGQYIHYTRTHKFIYIHFFLDDVGRFFLFSTHSLKSSIKSNSMSTAWSTDIQMKKFEWRKKKPQRYLYSIHLACNKCRYHSQFITFRIFRY